MSLTIESERLEKLKTEMARLPDGKSDTERRLEASLNFLLDGDTFKALMCLERLNANNNVGKDRCSDCGNYVDELTGCPDGAEVCSDCVEGH